MDASSPIIGKKRVRKSSYLRIAALQIRKQRKVKERCEDKKWGINAWKDPTLPRANPHTIGWRAWNSRQTEKTIKTTTKKQKGGKDLRKQISWKEDYGSTEGKKVRNRKYPRSYNYFTSTAITLGSKLAPRKDAAIMKRRRPPRVLERRSRPIGHSSARRCGEVGNAVSPWKRHTPSASRDGRPSVTGGSPGGFCPNLFLLGSASRSGCFS